MKNLREARDQGKLEEFAKAHEPENPGDEEAFNRALASMAGKSKEAPESSHHRVDSPENAQRLRQKTANSKK